MSTRRHAPSGRPPPSVPPPAASGPPLRLSPSLWQVAGEGITHPWDGSAYLVDAGEPTLLDCGSLLGYPSLRRALAEAGVTPDDVRRVLATHGHWDHVSGMSALAAESAAQLCLHPGDREAAETGDPVRTAAALLYGQQAPRLPVGADLHDGQLLTLGDATVEVLHTPGHSPGSVCFVVSVDSYRLLVAGDTLWGGFHPEMGSDIAAWTQSLDRLLELEVDFLTFGHGARRLVPDAHARLLEARSRLGSFYNPWGTPLYLRYQY